MHFPLPSTTFLLCAWSLCENSQYCMLRNIIFQKVRCRESSHSFDVPPIQLFQNVCFQHPGQLHALKRNWRQSFTQSILSMDIWKSIFSRLFIAFIAMRKVFSRQAMSSTICLQLMRRYVCSNCPNSFTTNVFFKINEEFSLQVSTGTEPKSQNRLIWVHQYWW